MRFTAVLFTLCAFAYSTVAIGGNSTSDPEKKCIAKFILIALSKNLHTFASMNRMKGFIRQIEFLSRPFFSQRRG